MAPTVRPHVTPTGAALVAKSRNTPCHTAARAGVDVESEPAEEGQRGTAEQKTVRQVLEGSANSSRWPRNPAPPHPAERKGNCVHTETCTWVWPAARPEGRNHLGIHQRMSR